VVEGAGELNGYPPIGDYALVGDCGCAALVSRSGAVEWMCFPSFHGASLFAAMLDREKGGRFVARPVGESRIERRYVEGTNVLETTFTTPTGVLRLTDLMPVRELERQRDGLWPDHELLRELACVEGEVEVEVLYDPRFDYGRRRARLRNRGPHGLFHQEGRHVVVLRSDLPLEVAGDRSHARGRETLSAGERRHLALGHDYDEPAVLPLLGGPAGRRIREAVEYWRGWSGRCEYDGPFADAVRRSLLALKLLTFSPSGAVVAAPTTSLPETIGGERNWDYRYCWLRDASFTVRALFELGYRLEARAFVEWLLNAIGGRQSSPQIVYDVYGSTRVPERTLDHLEGYRGSRPVRVGNDARDQLQLDVYGEVVAAVHTLLGRQDGRIGHGRARLLRSLGDTVCDRWREPDNGIWEKRSGRRHHIYSKVMCWVALDRLLDLHDRGHLEVPVERFRDHRERIREEVERRGWNEELGSYVAVYDGEELDASLLLLPLYGYCDADSPRMRGTWRAVDDRLGAGALLYRYPPGSDDGLAGHEGTFGLCGFWAVELLAMMGRLDEARERMRRLLAYANDVGLYAEEIDAETGAALGNFPQAFTHVGLINAALTLARAEEDRPREADGGGASG
jgi:GH15 family glucan-1,4-alpha-glucosidase